MGREESSWLLYDRALGRVCTTGVEVGVVFVSSRGVEGLVVLVLVLVLGLGVCGGFGMVVSFGL